MSRTEIREQREADHTALDQIRSDLDTAQRAAWAVAHILDATIEIGEVWERLPFAEKQLRVEQWADCIRREPSASYERIHEQLLGDPKLSQVYAALSPSLRESRLRIFQSRIDEILNVE